MSVAAPVQQRHKRIRGPRLAAIRERHFTKHPLCVDCDKKGIVALAEELDHIVPLFKGGEERESNRQGLCKLCHAVKTAKDLGHRAYQPRPTIGLDGYPKD